MAGPRDEAADEVARVRVELAAAAADATPLAELAPATRDLTRVRPLLERLAAAVARLLHTDFAVVWTTVPDDDVLLSTAWVGFPADYISGMRVPFGTGSAGRAVVERRVVLVDDVATSQHYGAFRDGALEQGVRAVLSVPMLTAGGEAMGALSAYYRESVVPDERDLELVDLYARQAAEIVERARLHAEARSLAARERRRAGQLRALADSALALSGADSLDELLRLVTEAAREVVGCHQGVTTRLPSGWADATTYVSLSEEYAGWRAYDVVPQGLGVLNAVTRENRPLRLTPEQLRAHPEWRGLADAPGHPPLPDYLAAPLVGRDGRNLGLVQLSHKLDDTPFTAEDEAILVQLAQMASSTVERLEAYEGERTARREAEDAARLRGVLSEASAVFAESFDPDGIAAALVDLVVPRLAELALLHVVDADGVVRLASAATADGSVRDRVTSFFAGLQLDPDAPLGAAATLRTGEAQLLPEITPEMVRAVARDEAEAQALESVLLSSGVCVPLTARGRTLGVLSLSRRVPYDAADLEHALDLGRRAALAMDNASRYAFERDLAVTLQRSLLPRELPRGKAFRAAARYLPGTRGTEVGGDWYDVVQVDQQLVLVVGDVVGRGVQAAAVMGQLQATVRAYALEGHSPAEVLTRLDRVAQAVPDLHFTTCVVALLDPQTGRLVVSSAGHLPPAVAGPGGARLLDVEPGLPLGVGGAVFVDQEHHLPPGSVVLLYTDGLVEERSASLTVGLDRLVACLDAPVTSAEEVCDRVLAALGRDGGTDDDTALLVLHLAPPQPVDLELPRVAEAVRTARHAVRSLLADQGLDPDVGELLVSELVGNAVRHGGPGDTVGVTAQVADGVLRVAVRDPSPQLPGPVRDPGPDADSGRGLLLVEQLARRWGADPLTAGKSTWFELPVGPVED